jgi:hypothetical protein
LRSSPAEAGAAAGDQDDRCGDERQRPKPGPVVGEVAAVGGGNPAAQHDAEHGRGDRLGSQRQSERMRGARRRDLPGFRWSVVEPGGRAEMPPFPFAQTASADRTV